MPDKLDSEIICKLPNDLTPINSPEASVILTDGYVLLNLIDHIFTINKQSSFLEDKRAKAIRGN
jgi:hypothetical protein